jgi:K+-transporting ATPase ATPase A chain
VAVFVAGLMIGRTPEYLGKKIEAFEVKMAAVAILVPPLAGAGRRGHRGDARCGPGRHRQPRRAWLLGNPLRLLVSRQQQRQRLRRTVGQYAVLQYAAGLRHADSRASGWSSCQYWPSPGSLAAKKRIPPGAGTLPTHTPLFVLLLIGTVIVVGALTFLPALALGPIVEQLQMLGAH